MISSTRGDYHGNRSWLQAVVGDRDWVLCHTSALEYLELFVGYMDEKLIEVYAKEPGEYENIKYRTIDSFDSLDVVNFGKVRCTSVNQTVNDMLNDFDDIDEQSLVEALATYYYLHNDSFDGLLIAPKNQAVFDSILSETGLWNITRRDSNDRPRIPYVSDYL
ncbi:MAG: hypothetical protein LBK56_06810 [Gracilibacteraceae bacterium]|jgi:hypothetical protein|nr:hypothetical protein [Gracilibacteraceae bacterium]